MDAVNVLDYNVQNDISVFYLRVSPESALNILEKYNYGKDRRVRQESIDLYANDMINGDWDCDASAPLIFTKQTNGQLNLMDGQHRLGAVIKSGVDVDFLVRVTKNKESLSDFYSKIDTGNIRHIGDTPAFIEKGECWGIRTDILKFSNTAIKNIYFGFVPTKEKVNNHAQSVFIDQWRQQILDFNEIYKESDIHKSRLLGAAPLGFSLIILRYNREKAIEFLRGAFTGSMLSQNDPRIRLHSFLREVYTRDMPKKTGKSRSVVLLYALHINVAWKKFIEGEEYKRPLGVYGIETAHLKVETTPYNTSLVGNGINCIEVRRLKADLI